MSDNLKKKKPQDASKINLNEPYEVNYWCDVLNVSKVELTSAVKSVGVSVIAVKKHLGK